MVQNSLFNGLPCEDLVEHIEVFPERCDIVHINNVLKEIIRMRLFPFALMGKAKA
ncbi:hypothetical protein Sjap_020084 [Stephania japonica]|uniref:Uncharacterized protein n=1 Tax=Stephania japonica TaxID=461633 RepID=A0AAP0F2R1_9MAGN